MSKVREKIASNIAKWDKEKSLSEYAREHFTQADASGTTKIANVLNNIYNLALSAESEDIQLKAAREIRETLALCEPKEIKQENTQINFYANASNQINENVQRLIAASPKKEVKKGIEGII
ncbi:MAG: hypothetical protein Q7U04_08330 [Bacteriovorax sp.]|nr:hypothetical protein [Bacteriovorax sp.]